MRKVSTIKRREVVEVRTIKATTLVIDARVERGRVLLGIAGDDFEIAGPIVPLPIPLDHRQGVVDNKN